MSEQCEAVGAGAGFYVLLSQDCSAYRFNILRFRGFTILRRDRRGKVIRAILAAAKVSATNLPDRGHPRRLNGCNSSTGSTLPYKSCWSDCYSSTIICSVNLQPLRCSARIVYVSEWAAPSCSGLSLRATISRLRGLIRTIPGRGLYETNWVGLLLLTKSGTSRSEVVLLQLSRTTFPRIGLVRSPWHSEVISEHK